MFGRVGPWALSLILLLRIHSALTVFKVTGPDAPVIALIGGEAVLDCQLIPEKPTNGMELQWVRSDLNHHIPIHKYIFGQDVEEQQAEAYRGRTEFFKDEFNQGNVSLKLKHVRLEDDGDYLCMIEQNSVIEQVAMKLKTASFGQRPELRLDGYSPEGIGLQCDSSSWYPAPRLHWSGIDGKDMTAKATTKAAQGTHGLYSVWSTIEVTSDSINNFKCLVNNTILNRSQQSILHIPDEFFPRMSKFFTAFILFLLLFLGIMGAAAFYQYRKWKDMEELRKRPTTEEYMSVMNQQEKLENDVDNAASNLRLEKNLSMTAAERVISAADTVADFVVTAPPDEVVAAVGSDVVLGCQLVPAKPLQEMEIQGGTQLFLDNVVQGNLSLRLKSVRVSDRGQYKCFVASAAKHSEIIVTLNVSGTGRRPWIEMDGYTSNGIRLGCRSDHWFPEPPVLWVNGKGEKVTAQPETSYKSDPQGLITVHSTIELPKDSRNEYTCVINNKLLKETEEAHIQIAECEALQQEFEKEKLAIKEEHEIFKTEVDKEKEAAAAKYQKLDTELEQWRPLVQSEWKRIAGYAATVKMDALTANANLTVSPDGQTVKGGETLLVPDNPERFDSVPYVLGVGGFTEGTHYWEVQVAGKTYWDVGVANGSVQRKGMLNLSSDAGFWTIGRDGTAYGISDPTRTHIAVTDNPQKIGVLLQLAAGRVSFYNADSMFHLYTFNANFSDKVYPFFWPGWDDSPLTICPVRN
ncbi:butyrophilin subfamily 2 member A1-like [Scyliorhinus canicula]|uniref:butyrophilin subfamily 2 member A1-like n=1 Tax=Scyliorhinus canicula TaxID=7830 RepID=UPI0018F57EA0|nr:butyrophilin subfamily 2 member A1-like [Scyliorhinus canicula]